MRPGIRGFVLHVPGLLPGPVVFSTSVQGVMICFLDRFYKPIVGQSWQREPMGAEGRAQTALLACLHEAQAVLCQAMSRTQAGIGAAGGENRAGAVNSFCYRQLTACGQTKGEWTVGPPYQPTPWPHHCSGLFCAPISGFMQCRPMPHIQTFIVTKIPNNSDRWHTQGGGRCHIMP